MEKWKRYKVFNRFKLYKQELLICKSCGSFDIKKRGRRENLYSPVQIFSCNNCGKEFSRGDFSRYEQFPPTIKEFAIKSNLSSRKTSDEIKKAFGVYVSHVAVLNWEKEERK